MAAPCGSRDTDALAVWMPARSSSPVGDRGGDAPSPRGARQRGIRVSAVRPGAAFAGINQRAGVLDEAAKARFGPLGSGSAHASGRVGTVEEIAESAIYPLTAEWTNGNVLAADGAGGHERPSGTRPKPASLVAYRTVGG